MKLGIMTSDLEQGTDFFSLNPEFLRHQGLLDESDPTEPLVVIPNFMAARMNCFSPSKYYNLCCNDRCEELMDDLEKEIQAPQASPRDILRVLGVTKSAYEPAGHNLFTLLEKRLQEVADQHGGEVPLHSRLFAQWMHFAHPAKCPYPHLSGVVKPITVDEWKAETGLEPKASAKEMWSMINGTGREWMKPSCDNLDEEGMCMWSPEEELVDAVAWHASARPAEPDQMGVRQWLRIFAFMALVVSSIVAMSKQVLRVRSTMLYLTSQGKAKELTV